MLERNTEAPYIVAENNRLSPLTFGTMRLNRAGSSEQVAHLIRKALEMGVTSFHVSREYATWPLFVDAWSRVRPAKLQDIQIIAKIGAPHFKENRFDPLMFQDGVDEYRRDLRVDHLDVVQWLLRYDLNHERGRQEIFDRDADLISEATRAMRDVGTIGGLMSFPYTRAIAERALKSPWCDGLTLYCNPLELDMVDLFDEAGRRGKKIVAIRPFAAGRLFDETSMSVRDAVQFPLSHPAVSTVIVSNSSVARLTESVEAANAIALAGWTENLRSARGSVHV